MTETFTPYEVAKRHVVGIDLSLTATGICNMHGATAYRSKLRGIERCIDIASHIIGHGLSILGSDIAIIEGYSMGGQRGSAGIGQMLGELGGIVRLRLYETDVPWVDIPPATLKKFATGRGNAGKPDMLAAAIRAGYDGPNDDNAVDAWWLRQMGLYEQGTDFVPITAYRDEVVDKIDWPANTNH